MRTRSLITKLAHGLLILALLSLAPGWVSAEDWLEEHGVSALAAVEDGLGSEFQRGKQDKQKLDLPELLMAPGWALLATAPDLLFAFPADLHVSSRSLDGLRSRGPPRG